MTCHEHSGGLSAVRGNTTKRLAAGAASATTCPVAASAALAPAGVNAFFALPSSSEESSPSEGSMGSGGAAAAIFWRSSLSPVESAVVRGFPMLVASASISRANLSTLSLVRPAKSLKRRMPPLQPAATAASAIFSAASCSNSDSRSHSARALLRVVKGAIGESHGGVAAEGDKRQSAQMSQLLLSLSPRRSKAHASRKQQGRTLCHQSAPDSWQAVTFWPCGCRHLRCWGWQPPPPPGRPAQPPPRRRPPTRPCDPTQSLRSCSPAQLYAAASIKKRRRDQKGRRIDEETRGGQSARDARCATVFGAPGTRSCAPQRSGARRRALQPAAPSGNQPAKESSRALRVIRQRLVRGAGPVHQWCRGGPTRARRDLARPEERVGAPARRVLPPDLRGATRHVPRLPQRRAAAAAAAVVRREADRKSVV